MSSPSASAPANARLDIGRGDDRLRIDSTHGGITIVNAGPGNDRINVRTVAGPTTINGGEGDDIVDVGTSFVDAWPDGWNHSTTAAAGVLDKIRPFLRIDGGNGIDTVNVDDSGDATSDVAILTGQTIDGLDLGSSPVQTVELLRADGGTFGLHVASSAAAILPFTATGAQVKAALLALHLAHVTDVVVNRAGNVFTIGFVGDEGLDTAALTLTVDASGLHYDNSAAPTDTAGAEVHNSGSGLSQTVDVRGGGSYNVTVGTQSFTVSASTSAADFFTALKAAIRAAASTLVSAEGRAGFAG